MITVAVIMMGIDFNSAGVYVISSAVLWLGWIISARRGVSRPKINGFSVFVSTIGVLAYFLLPTYNVGLPAEQLQALSATIVGFSGGLAFVFALERPRARPLRYPTKRRIPIR